jgi:DNA-binding CsgD family transcriptional regulator/GAF domain-containing protein
MERLRARDLRAILDVLEEVEDAPDVETFARTTVSALHRLVPADTVAYNEVDPGRNRAFFVADPAESAFDGSVEALERHMDDHPQIAHFQRTGDGRATKMSDFVTQRQLHRTGLYNDLYRPLRAEHVMAAWLPSAGSLGLAIAHLRGCVDFSARELAILEALRPHLARAHREAQAREELGALEELLEASGQAVVVLGRVDTIRYATPRARKLLAAFFTGRDEARLPAELERWLARERRHSGELLPPRPAPFVLDRRGRRLVARRIGNTLVLSEAAGRVTPESLTPLGLSRREAEVLACVADGKTNAEVALLLFITVRTVKKHLERIFDKLGVHTRTAAVAAAYAAGLVSPGGEIPGS